MFPAYASVSLLAMYGIHLIMILRGLTQILSKVLGIGYTFHRVNLNLKKKLVCVLAYVFMYRCASVYAGVQLHGEARGQWRVSPSVILHLVFFRFFFFF